MFRLRTRPPSREKATPAFALHVEIQEAFPSPLHSETPILRNPNPPKPQSTEKMSVAAC